MASQKLISNGYISVAQLNSVPPSAADLDMLGFTLLERNLILQTLKPPTESSEIKDLKRKCTELEQVLQEKDQEIKAFKRDQHQSPRATQQETEASKRTPPQSPISTEVLEVLTSLQVPVVFYPTTTPTSTPISTPIYIPPTFYTCPIMNNPTPPTQTLIKFLCDGCNKRYDGAEHFCKECGQKR
eukprot:TRINITY_DN330_c0_g1_i24.p1 TRINITY_DN330_c0_g1~~TRINITY_DN330_c0_g1_i24.p1  ORF type:complete len:185 (-),score=30.76 TRINITY_DN330_c0_g1_i24:75-629(-)